jgi:hypothetical protein
VATAERRAPFRIWCFAPGLGTDSLEREQFRNRLSSNRQPYYRALDAADAAYADGRIDVTAMEGLLGQMLAVQLSSVLVDAASGSSQAEPDPQTTEGSGS